MNFSLASRVAPVAVVLLLAAGCGSGSSGDVTAGPAMSDLAPSYDARPLKDAAAREHERARDQAGAARRQQAGGRPGASRPAGSGGREKPVQEGIPAGGGGTASVPGTAVTTQAPVRVEDPSGDLDGGLEGAPPSADVVAVQLARRGGMLEVRTTFAAAVPTRQTGDKGMNVASFYDVDDNGIVDYEVWTSLADNGWGTGHLDRRNEKATFGASTGIRVTVEGSTLVTRFPADRIGGADVFRWSAASEWGSYQSMSSSTSARDYAPDRGAVDYPG